MVYHLTPMRMPGTTSCDPRSDCILPTIRSPKANRAVAENAELNT